MLLSRSESSVRRLIKKHEIRTHKVFSFKGRELLISFEDLRQLLSAETDTPTALTLTQGAPQANLPDVVEVKEMLENFRSTLTTLAQTSSAQLALLERFAMRMENSEMERSDITETQRQVSETLANMNRNAKAQAAAMLQIDEQLRENQQSNPWGFWPATAGLVLVLIAAAGLYFGLNHKKSQTASAPVLAVKNIEKAIASEREILLGEMNQLTEQMTRQEVEFSREKDRRNQYFEQLEKKIDEIDSKQAETAVSAEKSESEQSEEFGQSPELRQVLKQERDPLKAEYDSQVQALEESARVKSFEINRLRLQLQELQEKLEEQTAAESPPGEEAIVQKQHPESLPR